MNRSLAFVLYKYFPYGGLQRDFLRIALGLQQKGYKIRIYVVYWKGEIPEGFLVKKYKVPWFVQTSWQRNILFSRWLRKELSEEPACCVIGFNKMPDLDIYYAADVCYEHKARMSRNFFYRLGGRYRHFAAWEKHVFSTEANTDILMLAEMQRDIFIKYYGTQAARMHVLPPGIDPSHKREVCMEERESFRGRYGLTKEDRIVLFLGSGFKTKGLDRALIAIASLPIPLLRNTFFFIAGQGKSRSFEQQAKKLKLTNHVFFLGGVDHVSTILQSADVLLHPAYYENTGTVLLEALCAGLPVLCTDTCGYAHYIREAQAGLVLESPFIQTNLNKHLAWILCDQERRMLWKKNGRSFASRVDLCGMVESAVAFIEDWMFKKGVEQRATKDDGL